jgi:hypothetical protein
MMSIIRRQRNGQRDLSSILMLRGISSDGKHRPVCSPRREDLIRTVAMVLDLSMEDMVRKLARQRVVYPIGKPKSVDVGRVETPYYHAILVSSEWQTWYFVLCRNK